MGKPETANDIEAMTFEEAMDELESIVRALEDGRGKLDEAIASYERGAALKRHCETRLKEAQMRVEKIMLSDGSVKTEPADLD